jgi:MFS family permease
MYEAPTGPLTIGQVLDHGFRLFKASFSSVWVFALIVGIVSIPFNSISGRLTQTLPSGQTGPGFVAFIVIAFFVYLIGSIVLYGAITSRIGGIATGNPITAGQALDIGWRRGPAYFLTSLLLFLILLFAFILLIIPGIWLGIALFLATYAVILERKGPVQSIQYSWDIVKGNWWRTFITMTIIGLIVGVAYVLIGLVVGLLVGFGIEDPTDPGPIAAALDYVVVPLIQVILLPVMYALIMALYYDLKLRHEGSDLAERIAAATE